MVVCVLQLLETMSYKSKPEDYTLGSQPENKDKNRAPDILPGLLDNTDPFSQYDSN